MSLDKFGKPQNIEKLPEGERIGRLHHQLSLIYDRVFLTGEWESKHGDSEALRESIFEDSEVNDIAILADGIEEFVQAAQTTLEKAVLPEEQKTLDGMQEHNRIVFLDILSHVRDILDEAKKDVNSREELDMYKCIDEEIYHFRDMPLQVRGVRAPSEESQAERYREGLQRILDRLETVVLENMK